MCPPHPAPPLYLITHEFHPRRGGIATFVEEMARACHALGHAVEVWAQQAPPEAARAWPFPVRRLPLKGTHNLSCQLGMARQLIRHRRELRHATAYLVEPGPMLGMMYLQAWRTFRPRHLVLTFHGSEILKFHHNPLIRGSAHRLIRRADRISVLSQFSHDLLCARFPAATPKLMLTPGALRSDFAVVPARAAPAAAKARLVVLTVGRLHPRKGQRETLRALQALPADLRARMEYWIVGVGNRPRYEQSLRTEAAAADFPVRLLGDVADDALPSLYAQADIFALTSVPHGASVEGFGLVYLEASAHGLPIIAHDCGGVAEATRDGETGLLVPPDQPAALTAAFARLLGDAALRHRLGETGRRHAAAHTWLDNARRLFPLPPATAPDIDAPPAGSV
jgi:phosphatidyl-myo-inositol dimannoside synthase